MSRAQPPLLPLLAGLALAAAPRGAAAQEAAVASDLWRVAQGTLITPSALSDDGAAPLWTPAVAIGKDQRVRVGVEAIQAPSEVGVTGGVIALSWRVPAVGVVNFTYGRLGLSGVGFTETSPESNGATLSIYNQATSVGVSRRLGSAFTAGVAVRYLQGRLGTVSRSQLGLDAGAQVQLPHVRLGATTRFFDPGFGASAQAASYNAGAEVTTDPLNAWGAPAVLRFRYGVTGSPGDGVAHLVTGGVALGTSLTLDLGGLREITTSDAVWRSLLGIGIGAGRYVVRIGRDGGAHGFGATYRFGLTAVFK